MAEKKTKKKITFVATVRLAKRLSSMVVPKSSFEFSSCHVLPVLKPALVSGVCSICLFVCLFRGRHQNVGYRAVLGPGNCWCVECRRPPTTTTRYTEPLPHNTYARLSLQQLGPSTTRSPCSRLVSKPTSIVQKFTHSLVCCCCTRHKRNGFLRKVCLTLCFVCISEKILRSVRSVGLFVLGKVTTALQLRSLYRFV